MNFLSKHFINRHQAKLLCFVIWLHISILDFFGIYPGPVFYFKESLQLNTLLTHAVIALLTLAFYFIVTKLFALKQSKSANNSVNDSEVLDKQCE